MVILVLTYVLPISSMVFAYARIGYELWGSQSIGERTARQIESIQNKRRVRNSFLYEIHLIQVRKYTFK